MNLDGETLCWCAWRGKGSHPATGRGGAPTFEQDLAGAVDFADPHGKASS